MKLLIFLVLAIAPVLVHSSVTRIACHRNSESFFELEYQGREGVLIHNELINRKNFNTEQEVSVSVEKNKITARAPNSTQSVIGIQFPMPIKNNAFVFTQLQQITLKGPLKAVSYGCVMVVR